jgi:DNA-directed RNA polymerase specialized sigma24 family protein
MRKDGDDGGLTPEQLEALLRSLHSNREIAGELLITIRRRLIRFFEWRGSQRPEELTDITIDRVARQLADKLTLHSDPYAYFCGVARLVMLESGRQEMREARARQEHSRMPSGLEDEPDPRLNHLRHCLQALPVDQRELVLRYHQGEQRIQDRKRLCREHNIEMNALRIRVHRIRRKIETCIQECLKGEVPPRPS